MNYDNKINYRNLIEGVDTKIPLKNGDLTTGINFDNAATTPPFVSVLNSVNKFAPLYSSSHRGMGYKSQLSTYLYENARDIVLDFIKGDKKYNTVVFVKNTTEAINKLSNKLYEYNKRHNLLHKNIILCTDMEHHSNDLPWRENFNIVYIKIDENNRLSLEDLKAKLEKYHNKIALVTVTGASNVTGYVNPIHEIASLAHKYNTKILVDGAQLIPHMGFSMKDNNSLEHIDFVAFSAHKMYAPFGTGVLIGPKNFFNGSPPDYKGGGTIDLVTHDFVKWADTPERDEAGSPNIIGTVALSVAIKTLKLIGMHNVEKHEEALTNYAIDKLRKIPGLTLYIDENNLENHISIIPFNIDGMYHEVTSKILSYEFGISTRSGCFCAHPYVTRILHIPDSEVQSRIEENKKRKPGMVRLSFGIYNSFAEIDILCNALRKIVKNKVYYISLYDKDDFYFFPI